MISTKDPRAFLNKKDFEEAATNYLKGLAMFRLLTEDRDNLVVLLQEVYNRGRSRGVYEGID